MEKEHLDHLTPKMEGVTNAINQLLKDNGLHHLEVENISFKLAECTPPHACQDSATPQWLFDHNTHRFKCVCL
jgi:hypothetical protein